ncbi:MAG: AbrB/MazE/SpoVT family DNA-binding domain-containing protein [Bryobacteraceae bacterium]
MAQTVTLSSKGQVVIPLEVRELLHLKAGERLELELRGNSIVLKPRDWRQFRGMFHGGELLTRALSQERSFDREAENRK